MKKSLTKKKAIKKKELEPPVVIIKNSCPLCEGDVKGNDKILYYCKPCNMLFRKKDLKSPHQSSKV